MKRIMKVITLVLVLSMIVGNMPVSAKSIQSSPYQGYDFDTDNTSVPAPNGYAVQDVYNATELKFEMGFGTASAIDYDGTDMERPFGLVNVGNQILCTDVSYNVVASYDVKVEQGNKVVYNVKNGYLFCPVVDGLDIYDTNATFVKHIGARDIGLSFFSPTTVVHVGDGIDDYIYALSGNTYVVFDGEGNFVETKSFDFIPVDLYYNTSSMCLYVLTQNSIVNITEETTIPLPFSVGTDARMVADISGMTFYIMTGGNLYQCNDLGELTDTIRVDGAVKDVSYNVEKDWLVVLTDKDEFSVSIYSQGSFVSTSTGYHLKMIEPKDLLFCKDFLYVLDSGNGRVMKLDTMCSKVYDIYESFIYEGEKLDIRNAEGMWIDGKRLFIADTEHERVVVSDFDGHVEKLITKPENLQEMTNSFLATKVITDREGNVYVICESVNMGAFLFSSDYEFKNFFGSNTVATTAEALANYIKKKILNKTQRSFLSSITPVTLGNFDIDADGFMYIVTAGGSGSESNKSNLVRKVNYLGKDILGSQGRELQFGDIEWDRQIASSTSSNTSFIDIDVNDNGWIVALDASRGKVFQYTEDGEYITAFGGMGQQLGMFTMPTAIENVDDKIYVLDAGTGSITVFKPTDYVLSLQEAFKHMNSADLELSVSLWNKVLQSNSNNGYAYYGLGIAYENAGMYKEAMEHFKLADAKEQYSKAFKAYRKEVITDNLLYFILLLVIVVMLITYGVKHLASKFVPLEGEAHAPIECKKGMPLYVLLHPFDGFQQFRTRGMFSTKISVGIVIAYFLISVLQYFGTGFIFNSHKAVNYNIISTLAMTVLIYVIFVVSNLAISTFMDGKGKLPYIISTTAYAMLPMLIAMLVNVGLSNVLAMDEEVFMTIIMLVGYLWSLFILLIGMVTIHEFTVTKTVLMLIFTVLAGAVFAVIGVLLITLMQQVVTFIGDIIYELGLR